MNIIIDITNTTAFACNDKSPGFHLWPHFKQVIIILLLPTKPDVKLQPRGPVAICVDLQIGHCTGELLGCIIKGLNGK